jgi:hypothetical protein
MAQQGRERKKSAIARRILRWIGMGVVSFLLIAAIIFQAPWKVIALLLIFLLACTVLPRPAKKWFWLSVAVIIVLLIIWVFLPEDNEGWRPYTFDEELAALQAKYAIPDSENAAVIYNGVLQEFDSNSFHAGFWNYDRDFHGRLMYEPWSAKDYPQVAKWLAGYESTIATLLEASEFEKCHFPINAEPFLFETGRRLSSMRCWAHLLVLSGNKDMGEGRVDRGLQKYIATLQMAKHLRQQPEMIDSLVGMSVDFLVARPLSRFLVLGEATEESLSVIQEAVGRIEHDWSTDLTRTLGTDKLIAKNFLATFYEVNPDGKVRVSHDPMATMRARFPQELPAPTYWQRRLTKAGIILRWFLMPSTPQEAAKIIDGAYERYYAMADPDFDWPKEPKELTITPRFSCTVLFNYRHTVKLQVDMSEKAYYRFRELYLRCITEQRGCILLIALRRYKNKSSRWPESLDEIESLAPAEAFIDPMNGGAFVYRPTDDNFTLYSKGSNNIDENGECEGVWPTYRKSADDRLIWPRESDLRKKRKVNVE